MANLKEKHQVFIPRWYGDLHNAIKVQLLGFPDASMGAYGCCIYIRIIHHDDSKSTSLITSKSRVSPIKPLSIPKLELQGAFLLSKLITQVKSELSLLVDISGIYCWCDSMAVLHWINGDSKKFNRCLCRDVWSKSGRWSV